MVSALGIPLRYIKRDSEEPVFESGNGKKLLITVDCQYGAGNVKKLKADEVAVIDHHIKEMEEPRLCDIRPYLGSCSTLIWKLLCDAGFSFKDNPDVGTALYYGLYTDTNNLSEIVHPLDMDLRDSVKYDAGLMKRLKNSNLSMSDLTIAGKTLNSYWTNSDTRSAIFEAEPCDPNILGFTSDLALQVDNIDACVVFCQVSGGVKLSIRSCVREVMANELASKLCAGVGSGGGHSEKAGGFISKDKLDELGVDAFSFLKERFINYYGEYDLVYSDRLELDLSLMERYRKSNIPVGFARSSDAFPAGTELLIRTLEGDSLVTADHDIYIMVGISQEIYPIKREKFEASYKEIDGIYAPDKRFINENHYEPTVKDRILGETMPLTPFIRPCVPTGETAIYVKELKKRTKVFTRWNPESYMFGDAGDYLAVREDDPNDAYVIEKAIFHETYIKIGG
jgi:phosphoglycolate phosphatase